METSDFASIAEHFAIPGRLESFAPVTVGHINDTYVATYTDGGRITRLLHQRINQNVFPQVDWVMENIGRVTAHLAKKLAGAKDAARRTLTLVPTRDGKPLWQSEVGDAWRTFLYIEDTTVHTVVTSPQQVYAAGKSFGEFHRLLSDLPAPPLHETIANFHHTPKRLEAMLKSAGIDRAGRAKDVRREIDFCTARTNLANTLLDAHAAGAVPLRTTHNDTKISNILFDAGSDEALCVIDLDTVMPGLSLYDVGDLIRTATSPSDEDERDLSRVHMRFDFFEALVRGYLDAMGDALTPAERALIPTCGKVITLEIGIRFLADYLDGDTYYRTHRPGHNLDRCRAQLKLVESIEQQEKKMNALVGIAGTNGI